MKKFAAFAAAVAVAMTPVSVARADAATDYNAAMECASFHVIAAVILSDGDTESPVVQEQAVEGAKYLEFAEKVNPSGNQDADLDSQVNKDMDALMKEGTDIEKFIGDRASMCEGLKARM